MLLHVGQLLECLVAVAAGVLTHVGVHERVLRQLLRRREGLEALDALIALVVHAVDLLRMPLHVALVHELLEEYET